MANLLNLSPFNLVWLTISLAAVVWLGCSELRRVHAPVRERVRRFLAVSILALALFPVVSDSDDALSLSFLNNDSAYAPAHAGSHRGRIQLIGLLDSLDHYRPGQICALVLLLLWLSIVAPLKVQRVGRAVACRGGRSPPYLSL